MNQFILASQSPRRKELLDLAGYSYEIHASQLKEEINRNLSPAENVQWLAEQKANDIHTKHPNAVVIGADTIVALDGTCLGKPKDQADASEMLQLLSGKTHQVLTGVTIQSENRKETFYESTEVTFWTLTQQEIDRYIKTGEPLDKAGSYGIQGKGALFVQKIAGDYFSVVGLPIAKTAKVLQTFGITPF
ncbi:Maf family protein [Bacillus sp. 179-C3.3 HS]|uniref:Maf family protein n=1 Tax=Bacillus sp. 179-C3.3 HS TaxID=3232162 RepID=UPI0039A072B0